MATSVHDLELPEVDLVDAERADVIAAFEAAGRQHWLCRVPIGLHGDAPRGRDGDPPRAPVPLRHLADPADGRRRGPDPRATDRGRSCRWRARSTRGCVASRRPRSRRRPPIACGRSCARSSNGLVDAFAARGSCELVDDVCEPYPIPIICELLGAPKEDWKLFSGWATDIFRIFNNDIATDQAADRGGDGRARRLRAGDGRGAPQPAGRRPAQPHDRRRGGGRPPHHRRARDDDRGGAHGRHRHDPQPARLLGGAVRPAPRPVGAARPRTPTWRPAPSRRRCATSARSAAPPASRRRTSSTATSSSPPARSW